MVIFVCELNIVFDMLTFDTHPISFWGTSSELLAKWRYVIVSYHRTLKTIGHHKNRFVQSITLNFV
jgi:hypothetical protein